MFYNHIILNNNEEELYLYLNYEYEFAKDLMENNKDDSILTRVKNYIKNKGIIFNGKKIFLVVNGIIISSLILSAPLTNNNIVDNYKYVAMVNFKDIAFKNDTIITDNNQVTIKDNNIKNDNIVNDKIEENIPSNPTVINDTFKLYRSNGQILDITVNDYLIGVIASEMPASFELNALKAQAVASRTYLMKRLKENKKIDDTTMNQVYKDINYFKLVWGNNFNVYYEKIRNAVISTDKEVIVYNGFLIDALYHSTSNGKTEDAVNVWGNSVPYLKSVSSPWDLEVANFYKEELKDFTTFNNIFGLVPENNAIEILSRTIGGRVNEIRIGNETYKGTKIRSLLGLRSADFDIVFNGNDYKIVTKGYGHGVGMSQYGANGMANKGYSYQQIINHYYSNVSITKI